MTKPRDGKPALAKVARSADEREAFEAKGYLGPEAYRAFVAALPKPEDPDEIDEDDLDAEEIREQIASASTEFDPNAAPHAAPVKNRGGRPRKAVAA